MRTSAAVLCLWLLAAPAARAQAPGLDDRTHRGATLEQIVEDLAKKGASWLTSTSKRVLFTWLVDNTPQMASSGQHKQLAAAISKHFAGKAWATHAVVVIDKELRLAQKPTGDLAAVSRALHGVAAKPENQVRDTMAAIAACAKGLASAADARAIALFTLENGDTERFVEETGALLRGTKTRLYVIAREAVHADPYWPRRTGEAAKYAPLQLAGAEAPYVEFPWGFLFHMRDPHESVPSGFGIYGHNRLVTLSGGAYYLYDPPATESRSWCSWVGCHLCGGSHRHCGALYDSRRLKMIEPSAASRTDQAYQMQKNPHYSTIFAAWDACQKLGLLYSQPPELAGSTSRVPRASPAGGYYAWNIAALEQAKARALRDRPIVLQWIARLRALPEPKKPDALARRAEVEAHALRALLAVTRFNLHQLASLHDHAQQLIAGQPASEIAQRTFPAGTPAAKLAVTYYNVPLCHGTRPLREMRWLGADADADLAEASKEIDGALERVRGTPWELVVRRAALVRFHIYEPVQGTVAQVKRRREGSQNTPPETTTTSSPRPERSRDSGSRTGSGGATTGH